MSTTSLQTTTQQILSTNKLTYHWIYQLNIMLLYFMTSYMMSNNNTTFIKNLKQWVVLEYVEYVTFKYASVTPCYIQVNYI